MKYKYFFYLRNPKSVKDTLIMFGAYISSEKKRFACSTGISITPLQWNQEKYKVKETKHNHAELNNVLTQYSELYKSIMNNEKALVTISFLKQRFSYLLNKKKIDYNNMLFSYNSLNIKNLEGIKNSIEKIDKKDRTLTIEQCYQEILANLKEYETYITTNKKYEIGDLVILNPNHPKNKNKDYRLVYSIIDIVFKSKFKGYIGYNIKEYLSNKKSKLVSELQIINISEQELIERQKSN